MVEFSQISKITKPNQTDPLFMGVDNLLLKELKNLVMVTKV